MKSGDTHADVGADAVRVDVWVGLYLSGVDVHDIVRADLHVDAESVWCTLEDAGVVFRFGGRRNEAGELGALAAWAVTYDERGTPHSSLKEIYDNHRRISRSGIWVRRQGHGGGGSHGMERAMIDVWSLVCEAGLDSWTVTMDSD